MPYKARAGLSGAGTRIHQRGDMEKHNQDRCLICGAIGPLSRAHIVPRTLKLGTKHEDFMWLCANCHQQMDRGQVREFEFEAVLAGLMRASKLYEDGSVREDAPMGGDERHHRVDLTAVEKSSGRTVVIECKSGTATSLRLLEELAADIDRYKEIVPNGEFVLAVATRFAPERRSVFTMRGIEVWDLDEIASRFHDQLSKIQHPVLGPILLGIAALNSPTASKTPEALLSEELTSIKPGREQASTYQRLIRRILERLFVPPLAPPLWEHADAEGYNRRDIILPNYAESGFWAYMRQRYAADFIVADAKNFTDDIGKGEALQILNYLKADGAGLFGLLITRKGLSEACQHALADHWTRHGKMVICLSDNDVHQMLRLKEANESPEAVIRQGIEGFRLGL